MGMAEYRNPNLVQLQKLTAGFFIDEIGGCIPFKLTNRLKFQRIVKFLKRYYNSEE